jgi:hypothetical protein
MIATGPPKENGAPLRAPTPPTILAQNNCDRANMQHVCDPRPLFCGAQNECEHGDTRVEQLASGPHFAKEICTDCGRVLRWIPKPQTIARQQFNALRLVKLAMHSGLSPWERAFIDNISKRRKLSPKQQALLDRLVRQYLEAKPS